MFNVYLDLFFFFFFSIKYNVFWDLWSLKYDLSVYGKLKKISFPGNDFVDVYFIRVLIILDSPILRLYTLLGIWVFVKNFF